MKTIYENDLVGIFEAIAGFGSIGFDSELGYGNVLPVKEEAVGDCHIISAHAPSTIGIEVKKRIEIFGYMHYTSMWSPESPCYFWVSGNLVGYLYGPKDVSRPITLEPGKYLLEIETGDMNGKHSLWAYREVKS